jgi:hypothetical protein
MFGSGLMAADDEKAFISLVSKEQVSKWAGDRAVWTVQGGEIHGYAAGQPTALVYEGRSFGEYVLRFSARARRGSVRILLRNLPFAWVLEIDTEKVWLRAGGGEGFVAFFNKPGEWADYEVRMRGGRVQLVKDGKPSALDYEASHMPETGKISLQLSDTEQGSDFVLRNLRIWPDP